MALSACGGNAIPGVYRIDIPQGNIITQEMLDQLKPGMSKSQVRFLLGTPLLVDVFHQDRWDYLYSYQPGGKDRLQRRVSVFFSDDKLTRLEGDVEFSEGTLTLRGEQELKAIQVEEKDQGFVEYVKETFGVGKRDADNAE